MYVSIYLSIYLPIYLSIYVSIYVCIYYIDIYISTITILRYSQYIPNICATAASAAEAWATEHLVLSCFMLGPLSDTPRGINVSWMR